MKNVSEKFLAAAEANPRYVTPFALMDFCDPDAEYGEVAGATVLPFCTVGQLYNRKIGVEKRIVTLEKDLFLLDGSREIPEEGAVEAEEVGIALEAWSDENCLFAEGAFIELPISNVQVLQSLTLAFDDDPMYGWPPEYTVSLKVGENAVWEQTVTDGTGGKIILDGFCVYDPTAVRVTFTKWSWPMRRARILEIALGIFEEWTGADMYEVDVLQQTDFTNLTVCYDTARIVVRNETHRFNPRAKGSVFASIEARQPVQIFYGVASPGDKPEKVSVGVFYLQEEGWETAATDTAFELNFVSIIGLLAERVPEISENIEELPKTVTEWLRLLLSTVGENFTEKFTVDDELAEVELTASPEDLQGMNCGDILRYICMAVGAIYRADTESGKLLVQKIPEDAGVFIPLSQQFAYPVESRSEDWADIAFMLADDEVYTVGGNTSAAEKTCKVDNPFIKTREGAERAAKNILQQSGGSTYKLAGRGNPASDIGDIDTFETIFGERVSARLRKQQLKFSDCVMLETPSWLVQSGWQYQYGERLEFTESCTWTAPEGVSKIRLVLIGRGEDGKPGGDGSYSADGEPGAGGAGGLVWIGDIGVTAGGIYAVNIGEDSTFGTAYTSANGKQFAGGWGDIYSGKVYAANGTDGPERCKSVTDGADGESGTGCGGQGGGGGRQGARAWDGEKWIYKRRKVSGGAGGKGATGCVIIYISQ